jgi:hypothetical protein
VTDPVVLVVYMVSGAQFELRVPQAEVDDVLADVADAMRYRNQLLFSTAKMLFNGAHISAVVPKER